MGVSRRKAQEYADRLMERPRSALELELRRGRSGTTLLHEGKAVTHCYGTKVGLAQAREMAVALGVRLPEVGASVRVTVPNGTFFRVIAISSLPLNLPEVAPLLLRYQEEAAMARTLGEGLEV
ncbi:MAG: hypothetical protein HYU30_02190 [Chloroflexi bacterium]|nr:hypothetical protein [Chloroflexota bacterium]